MSSCGPVLPRDPCQRPCAPAAPTAGENVRAILPAGELQDGAAGRGRRAALRRELPLVLGAPFAFGKEPARPLLGPGCAWGTPEA